MALAEDLRMPHPLRWFVPRTVYEFTTRTLQERFLLRPSAHVREIVLGVIARGLLLYPAVQMHAFAFLSNHWHAMLSSADGAQLAHFMGYANSNVAKELGRIHGWAARLWARRARPIPILDEESMVARLRYILAQGVKEGLVERPEEWPGATSTPWLLGEELVGVWIDRDLETRARRRSRNLDPSCYTTRYEVRMAPIPCWAHLTRDQIASRTRALIDEVVAEGRARGIPVLGVDRVLSQDPHGMPQESNHSPAPLCHAACQTLRLAFRTAYRAFVGAFRAAADSLKAGHSRVEFPPGSFPCSAAYVRPPDEFAPLWVFGALPTETQNVGSVSVASG
jgi:hypothetical protein